AFSATASTNSPLFIRNSFWICKITFNRFQLLAVSYQLDWAVLGEVSVVPDRPCRLPQIRTPAEY
ncbi:hypothetical protein, partial [Microcoleus anatoxicus]